MHAQTWGVSQSTKYSISRTMCVPRKFSKFKHYTRVTGHFRPKTLRNKNVGPKCPGISVPRSAGPQCLGTLRTRVRNVLGYFGPGLKHVMKIDFQHSLAVLLQTFKLVSNHLMVNKVVQKLINKTPKN